MCKKRIVIPDSTNCPHCGSNEICYKVENELNWDLDNRCRICYGILKRDGECPHIDQHHRWKDYRYFYKTLDKFKNHLQRFKTKTIKIIPIVST
jgi:hypothetical protein